tara:strand:- start:232 stop:828 length:597 start_codon:yes stop_codon:yes gene_type:complete
MLRLVLPDAGPLISLGLIDRLDLLDRFDCAIVVTDMVRYELERGGEGAPDKPALDRWFSKAGNRIQSIETTYGLMYQALPPDVQRRIRLTTDAGENSIREFSDHARHTLSREDQILILYEDGKVPTNDFGPQAHLVHTFAFLSALENMGVIQSADALREAIHRKRRSLARDLFDRPAVDAGDESWTQNYDTQPGGSGM